MITRTWRCAVHGEHHRIVIDDEKNGTELAAAAVAGKAHDALYVSGCPITVTRRRFGKLVDEPCGEAVVRSEERSS